MATRQRTSSKTIILDRIEALGTRLGAADRYVSAPLYRQSFCGQQLDRTFAWVINNSTY